MAGRVMTGPCVILVHNYVPSFDVASCLYWNRIIAVLVLLNCMISDSSSTSPTNTSGIPGRGSLHETSWSVRSHSRCRREIRTRFPSKTPRYNSLHEYECRPGHPSRTESYVARGLVLYDSTTRPIHKKHSRGTHQFLNHVAAGPILPTRDVNGSLSTRDSDSYYTKAAYNVRHFPWRRLRTRSRIAGQNPGCVTITPAAYSLGAPPLASPLPHGDGMHCHLHTM